jgi:AraC-like DNA-binding protein
MRGVGAESALNPDVRVWDTRSYSPRMAFRMFRESMETCPLPSLLEYTSEDYFQARMEAAPVKDGLVARVRCTPHVAVRRPVDCRNSNVDGYNITYRLAGACRVEEGERSYLVGAGDILVRDSRVPCKITMATDAPHELVAFCIPRSTFARCMDLPQFEGALIVKKRTPFANCLELLASCLNTASRDELAYIYDACLALLPLELNRDHANGAAEAAAFGSRADQLRRAILAEIDRDLSNIDLSPEYIARKFHISVRYVHKLFAAQGDTCRSYILQRRLDCIRQELISSSRQQEPISSLAYRWGFIDVPTFNRAFKRRFGCTPSRFRGTGD